jgi:hypothetical protein
MALWYPNYVKLTHACHRSRKASGEQYIVARLPPFKYLCLSQPYYAHLVFYVFALSSLPAPSSKRGRRLCGHPPVPDNSCMLPKPWHQNTQVFSCARSVRVVTVYSMSVWPQAPLSVSEPRRRCGTRVGCTHHIVTPRDSVVHSAKPRGQNCRYYSLSVISLVAIQAIYVSQIISNV